MKNWREKLANSYFIVNKLYVFLIFIWLSIADAALGIFYFIMSLFVYGWNTLNSKVPIVPKEDFNYETYVYKKTEELDLKVDIWYPNFPIMKKYPLVYFCHGGGWISGFRNQPNNVSWCKFLAEKGFVVASIDYRYGFKNTMTDILSDYIDGLDFLKENADELRLDTSDITLMGLSAGGHLSLLYSTYFSSLDNDEGRKHMEGVKSVVGYYSPTDLKDILIDDNKSIFAKLAIRQTLKGSSEEIDDVYDFYSPINYLTKNMVPVLLAHGKEDNTVPFISSVKFAKKLIELEIPYQFLIHKTGDHSFDTTLKDYTTINILEQTARFIRKY